MTNMKQPEFTVSELSNQIKMAMEGAFPYVTVRGEISGFKRAPSGHLYLNLKDENANLSAVCWKGNSAKFKFQPEDGLEVIASGSVTTFAGQSKYQLIIDNMEPAGTGALMALLEKRKKQLAAEGLFDALRKKPIPYIPQVIGVVTSPTGAVIRDILHRISDRFPTRVIVWPVLVQGEKAAGQIATAIEGFNRFKQDGQIPRPDVIIVARGGGSIEDLWAFNEEIVVRAVADCEIPIISAVGHETDVTLLDFASDLRAPTPTAAAEMAVPVKSELILLVCDLSRRGVKAIFRLIETHGNTIKSLSRALPNPKRFVDEKAQRLDNALIRMDISIKNLFKNQQQKLEIFTRLLESCHYKRILERGFTLVRDKKGKIIKSVKSAKEAANINIEFADGAIGAICAGGSSPQKSLPRKNPQADNSQESLF